MGKAGAGFVLIALLVCAFARGGETAGGEVTFTRDVLPILQKHCQSCHRSGEIGPMPLITYRQTRPWAQAIREAVRLRRMPPWSADPRFGSWANDPSLSAQEIETLAAWARTGAPEGAAADAPPPVRWRDGWRIMPDKTFRMPKPFPVAARTTIDYQYIILPTRLVEDQWVTQVEVRPSDRGVVHHAVLYVREKASPWLRDAPPGVMYVPPAGDETRRARATTSDILAIYTPGSGPAIFPSGMAKKIPAGADLVLQMHYAAKETATQDQTEIGLVFSRTAPEKRVLTLQMGKDDLRIPPGERDYRASVSGTLPREALLLNLYPHMHLRGSAFEFEIVKPGGQLEPLLWVKPYQFHWQFVYWMKTPRLLAAGTRLRWTGHFDNSTGNPRNPDPDAEVTWGEQSWDEMMIGFFDVAVGPGLDKQVFFRRN